MEKVKFYLEPKTGNSKERLIMGDDDDEYARSICRELRAAPLKKILVIMRGLPGSGKSTLASKIKLNGVVLSADNYFLNNKGVYVFDKRKLDEAHAYAKSKAKEALEKGTSPVIIDNTNLKVWEFKPYVKMACEYDYEVKLVEPNTKWKSKVGELVKKNVHNVPYDKIKNMSFDFEHNIDLDKILNEFKKPQRSDTVPASLAPAASQRLKPSGLLFGANESYQTFFQTPVEWLNITNEFCLPPTPHATAVLSNTVSTVVEMVNKSVQTSTENSFNDSFKMVKARDIQLSGGRNSCFNNDMKKKRVVTYDRSCDTLELNESLADSQVSNNLATLLDLFGDRYDKSFYIDLLVKYDNDVNCVANLISETVDLSDVVQSPVVLKSPQKLSELCTVFLNSMNEALKRHFSVVSDRQLDYVDEQCSSSSTDTDESVETTTTPAFTFKLDKAFARTLFEQFADSSETFNENDSFEVDCDLTLAFEIYKNLKKTKKKNSDGGGAQPLAAVERKKKLVEYEDEEEDITSINEKIRQIESDAQLALEIFEHENMCHPIDGYPIYLSDYGVNAASISLRQIMAEQTAESKMQQKHTASLSPGEKPSLAVHLKRRQILEMYSSKIDTDRLDEIFCRNSFNVDETVKFIESKLGIKARSTAEKTSTQSRKKLPTKSPPPPPPGIPKKPVCRTYNDAHEYRELAHEYFQIRQEYFEKATEAYSRGWGAVAQFYAEMGQKQGIYMKKSNETASVNIFALNNADLNNSNTLDLHGLHVSEAVRMFKQIYKKKQDEYRTSYNKKQKWLYVLTGWGRHSVNRNARLRPQMTKYMNQKSIRFEEPNIGLFRVELG